MPMDKDTLPNVRDDYAGYATWLAELEDVDWDDVPGANCPKCNS